MNKISKIIWFEPVVFIFFGLFHLHRIWAFIDRGGYSEFWISLMENRGVLYFILTGIMSALCVAGIAVFIINANKGKNYWWRWFYIFGGGYVLFDLCAILLRFKIWQNLLYKMFDAANPYWNIIWGTFVSLGLISLLVGVLIFKEYQE